MKRTIAFLLALVLLCGVCGLSVPARAANVGLENFQKKNSYVQGQFTDVASDAWYTANVAAAFEYGLMNGNGDGTFNIRGNLTIAETLTLAARLHNIYNGGTGVFQQGSPWYQVYVDYAIEQGIITAGFAQFCQEEATRADFAIIFSRVFPSDALPAINSISNIPDVPANYSYHDAVLMLYNAGILTGNDDQGTFLPESNIVRSEVATIVTRMVDKSLRRSFTSAVAVTGISLDQTSLSLTVGKTATLTATVWPNNATNKTVTWKSSSPAVATVENGVVKALSPGTTYISAVAGDQGAGCTVTVVPATIKLDQIAFTLKVGSTMKVNATTDPTGKAVSWSSGNPAIATVDASGLVTAVSEGKADIFATLSDGTKTFCTVTVEDTVARLRVDKEYGPMTLARYSTGYNSEGDYESQIQITSFVFTSISQWKQYDGKEFITLEASIQGTAYDLKDNSSKELWVYGYDTANRCIAQIEFDYLNLPINGSFNTMITERITKETFDKIDHIEFYSSSAEKAVSGIQDFRGTNIGDVSHEETKQTTIQLPSVPLTLNNYSYSDKLQSTFQITDIRYEISGTTLYLYFAGSKTYDARGSGQSDTCKIGWKLYDSEGYVVDTGTCYSPGSSVGDKFRDVKDYIYGIKVGSSYRLEVLSTN